MHLHVPRQSANLSDPSHMPETEALHVSQLVDTDA